MEVAQLRLNNLAAHFNLDSGHQKLAAERLVRELQHLLEHDNHATRQQMKDLMRDPLFVPCALIFAP